MLQLTFYGHACVLFEHGGTRLLCDPHLYEQFAHDLFKIYPARRIDRALVPRPDAIFISHKHRDHFDLRSLSKFDRSIPVFIPDSDEMRYGLGKLGFATVDTFKDWDTREVGGMRLTFTPSRMRVPENGVVVTTGSEAAWNLVDTVIDLEIVRRVQRDVLAHRQLDVLLWPYQPLLEFEVSEGKSLAFPRDAFEQKMATLATVSPRHAVPYADAQFGVGETAWLNHYRFPVEFGEIVAHARNMAPHVELLPSRPGDRLAVDGTRVEVLSPAPYIEALTSSAQERCFDTTRGAPELRAHDLGELAAEQRSLAETVDTLREGWRVLSRTMRPALALAAQWEATYDLVLEHGDTSSVIRFTPEHPEIEVLDGEGALAGDGNRIVMRTRLGLLQHVLFGELHYISAVIAGLIRSWHRVFKIENGELVSAEFLPPDNVPSGSERGQLLPATSFLNLLVGSSDRTMRTRYIESELREALRAAL
jgi:hypothetical protein